MSEFKKHQKPINFVDIVFVEIPEKPPHTLEFIEVENERGESVNFGYWQTSNDGYVRLRIPLRDIKE